MKAVVIGALSASAFACLLRDRSHDVTLAARDPAGRRDPQPDGILATREKPT